MTEIIKGDFAPKRNSSLRSEAGNPNPGDPRQPSPPMFRESVKPLQGPTNPGHPPMPWEDGSEVMADYAEAGADRSESVLLDNGKPVMMTPDQNKAIALILSGEPFICIGAKSTATGCDFYTAMGGDEATLRNCYDDLPGVVHRLYKRKNLL